MGCSTPPPYPLAEAAPLKLQAEALRLGRGHAAHGSLSQSLVAGREGPPPPRSESEHSGISNSSSRTS